MGDQIKPAQENVIRQFNADFCRDLPEGALSGLYSARKGDRFDGRRVMVPDGRYRIAGSDWILGFERSRFIDAVRAGPPDFGGSGVVVVP